MSVRVLRYSRPNAELRGMISRLLSPEQLRTIAASPDLEGALRLLLGTGYSEVARDLLDRGATVTDAERSLARGIGEAHRRTAFLLGGARSTLVVQMVRRLEVENLKTILRAKGRGEPVETVRPLLAPLGDMSSLPYEDLFQAGDVGDVIQLLSGGEYGRVLAAALPRYEAERTLFPLETALDLHYYGRLWDAVRSLSGKDLQVARQMIGTRFDVLNVDWILRYRLIFHLFPEEVFNYTIPHGWRIDDGAIRRAVPGEGVEAIASALPEPYRSIVAGAAGAPDPVERAGLVLQRHLVGVARSALSGDPFQLGVAVAFLWLKEAEAHDLQVVLEAKRYGLPLEATLARFWRAE